MGKGEGMKRGEIRKTEEKGGRGVRTVMLAFRGERGGGGMEARWNDGTGEKIPTTKKYYKRDDDPPHPPEMAPYSLSQIPSSRCPSGRLGSPPESSLHRRPPVRLPSRSIKNRKIQKKSCFKITSPRSHIPPRNPTLAPPHRDGYDLSGVPLLSPHRRRRPPYPSGRRRRRSHRVERDIHVGYTSVSLHSPPPPLITAPPPPPPAPHAYTHPPDRGQRDRGQGGGRRKRRGPGSKKNSPLVEILRRKAPYRNKTKKISSGEVSTGPPHRPT